MLPEIENYNNALTESDKAICDLLANTIDKHLKATENKIWHRHPVWFIEGNPICGYDKLKDSVRLMFWSGADFEEEELKPGTGKFKDASVRYTTVEQVDVKALKRWLKKGEQIQWDYKNIVKRKGKLVRLV